MTEPTRDALHAETLAKADRYARSLIAGFEDSDVQEAVESVAVSRAYLALRAEVERLRAKAAIVDAMERRDINVRYLGANADGELIDPWRVEGVAFKGFAHAQTIAAAYAAATREGIE